MRMAIITYVYARVYKYVYMYCCDTKIPKSDDINTTIHLHNDDHFVSNFELSNT